MSGEEHEDDREPPAPLPWKSAGPVVRAVSGTLMSPFLKLLWLEMLGLCQGEGGCYIGPGALAERLGVVRDTVESGRRVLLAAGLLKSRRDPANAQRWLWYPVLPAFLLPLPASRPSPEDVSRLSAALSQHLAGRQGFGKHADETEAESALRKHRRLSLKGGGKRPSAMAVNPPPLTARGEAVDSRRMGGQSTASKGGQSTASLPIEERGEDEEVREEKRESSLSISSQGGTEEATAASRNGDRPHAPAAASNGAAPGPTWEAVKRDLRPGTAKVAAAATPGPGVDA